MLLTVLLISGGILSITTITAHLMAQRLRLASNINDSTKAIFAADAGIEWSLYQSSQPEKAGRNPWSRTQTKMLSNGAQFTSRSQVSYVRALPERRGWITPRCAICDKDQNSLECRDRFTSQVSYSNICFDNFCIGPPVFFGLPCELQNQMSMPYTATSTTAVSVGESRNVVRALELSF